MKVNRENPVVSDTGRMTRRTQAQRTAATRAVLIEAARKLFAEKGFADVSTQTIVAAAGVTRGALYHQFDDKAALFAAVYEDVERRLGLAEGTLSSRLARARSFSTLASFQVDPASGKLKQLSTAPLLKGEDAAFVGTDRSFEKV